VDSQRTRAVVIVHRRGRELTRWSVVADDRPDIEVIDELARAVLTARREGDDVQVKVFCPQLKEIVHLAGLTRTLDV